MKKMVEGLKHYPGVHCCSTSVRDIVNFHGHELSEAMCFGLASGLGFTYWKDDKVSPSRCMAGRAEWIAPQFFQNIGMPFTWEVQKEFPWPEMKKYLDNDVPILLLTDIYYLEYYGSSTHFAGHCVVLAGYDEEHETVFLGDTDREGWQTASLASLEKAMNSVALPVSIQNYWQPFPKVEIASIESAIVTALMRQYKQMQHPSQPIVGLTGMQHFVKDLKNWSKEAADLDWCLRFSYQVIEKRGTGGGNFRLIYSSFLEEAHQYFPGSTLDDAAAEMKEIAALWTELAYVFKELSESFTAKQLENAIALSRNVCSREKDFYLRLSHICENLSGLE
ncbi:BtrH N-terminal domain-containing protein [Metallumcola ferriviriculae]|uniref:BtrH N-terminal domain-containing protein n=1 Tax=Metallumcola ferriviriculae TaxID=3039180 RepID=A0AAU0UN74_9FIRM|nr:BtrH N-terminal domain-containing protein [Desulfitibacteraceae bacterium MK1]